jgi:hypothetical protein
MAARGQPTEASGSRTKSRCRLGASKLEAPSLGRLALQCSDSLTHVALAVTVTMMPIHWQVEHWQLSGSPRAPPMPLSSRARALADVIFVFLRDSEQPEAR